MNAVLADHRSRRRDHPAGAVLLQPRDGDRDGRRERGRRCRRRRTTSSICEAIGRGDDAADARDRDRVARTIRPARSIRRRRCAPSTRCAGSAASSTFTTRRTSTSPTATSRHFSPGSIAGCGRAHHLALLAVEGVRDGELAHRLHGDPGVAVGCGQQDPGHAADLPAGGIAAGGDRGAAGRRARYADAHRRAPRRDAAPDLRRARRGRRAVRRAGRRRRLLLLRARALARSIR